MQRPIPAQYAVLPAHRSGQSGLDFEGDLATVASCQQIQALRQTLAVGLSGALTWRPANPRANRLRAYDGAAQELLKLLLWSCREASSARR